MPQVLHKKAAVAAADEASLAGQGHGSHDAEVRRTFLEPALAPPMQPNSRRNTYINGVEATLAGRGCV